jgi:hypothetical protein
MAMEAVSMGAEEELKAELSSNNWGPGAGQPPCESRQDDHGDDFFFSQSTPYGSMEYNW